MAKKKQVFAYNDEYLKLGFTSIEVNGEVRPQCALCLTILAHSSLEETKLRRHLESNRGNFVNKSLEVFKEKEGQVKRSRIDRPTAWKEEYILTVMQCVLLLRLHGNRSCKSTSHSWRKFD